MSAQDTQYSPDGGPAHDITDDAAAFSDDAAPWLLHRLADDGDVTLRELSFAFGADAKSWLAVGQLLRARYIVECGPGFAVTENGVRALERFESVQASGDEPLPERLSA